MRTGFHTAALVALALCAGGTDAPAQRPASKIGRGFERNAITRSTPTLGVSRQRGTSFFSPRFSRKLTGTLRPRKNREAWKSGVFFWFPFAARRRERNFVHDPHLTNFVLNYLSTRVC